MTRIVNALEEGKLVVKAKDPGDGRNIRIFATTKGKRLLLQGRARRVRVLAEQIERLEQAEQENLSAALAIIQTLTVRTS
jgi:DNA-binding MarR family transcriptional regulator